MLLVVALALPALPAQSVGAVNRVVTKLDDDNTAGTLRREIATALPNDTIIFQSGLTGAVLLEGVRGPLVLSKNVTIQGPGRDLFFIDGGCTTCTPTGPRNDGVRVFTANSNVTATISGVTITKGRTSTTDFNGGGIRNDGTLTVVNSTISGNTTGGGGVGGSGGAGGGISSGGTLTVTGSTFSGNTGGRGGGGIYNESTLVLGNDTISGNTTTGVSAGGGILSGGTLIVRNITVARAVAVSGRRAVR